MLYDFDSAILRAKGDSSRPFAALTVSGIINVLLNLFFVIVCHLGVAGVAIATDISTAVSALLVCMWLFFERSDFHLSIKKLRIKQECLLPVLTIGIPSAIQGAVFCFANIFVQASVNSFGTITAACIRIMRILLFEPICGFYEVPAGVLRGTGHSTLPAVLTVIGTCLLRIAWIFTVFSRTPSPEILFIIFPISWVVTIILMWGGFFLKHPLHE